MRRTRREVVQSFLDWLDGRDVFLARWSERKSYGVEDPPLAVEIWDDEASRLVDQWLADTGPGRPAGDTVARVVALAAEGQTDEEIARALGVTPGTARAYRSLGKRRGRAGRPSTTDDRSEP